MSARTYDELFEPAVRLSLVRTPSGWCSVIDQHGQLYFPPVQDIQVCLRFMVAMRDRKDAVPDDASVERATWFSVKVPALEPGEAVAPSIGDVADGTSPGSNVVPIRRREAS